MALTCLITGITGQTGAWLAAHLIAQGHAVEGTSRTPDAPSWRLEHLGVGERVELHSSDLETLPDLAARGFDRIYHLAAQSSVAASFENPAETVRANIGYTAVLLTAIRDHSPKTRLFNAASSEILEAGEGLLNETSPRRAGNPYAVTKLAAMNMGQIFKDGFGIYVSNGILFNHESELRDARFVSAKIISNLCAMAADKNRAGVELGNLLAQRDFSHAQDVAAGIAASLNPNAPRDYVFASGQLRSVREFFDAAAAQLGFAPQWSGQGIEAICKDANTGRTLASVNPKFYRPIDELPKAGDAARARADLGWSPQISFDDMIARMIAFYKRA